MRRRPGLTLVEMLVALALAVFMMAILSEAFVTGLKAFEQLKALADLEQQLRTAANVLRSDLTSPHFEGNRKLSELTLSGQAVPGNAPAGALFNLSVGPIAPPHPNGQYRFVSPELGFLRIEENNASVAEAVNPSDTYQVPGYRDYDDVLHFTARREGRGPEEVFRGESATQAKFSPGFTGVGLGGALAGGIVLDNLGYSSSRYDEPGNAQFASNWAEILYFTRIDTNRRYNSNYYGGLGAHAIPGGATMFNLYRREMLLLPDAQTTDRFLSMTALPAPNIPNAVPATYWQHFDVSATWFDPANPTSPITGAGILNANRGWYFNSPADIQFPARRYNWRVTAGDPNYDSTSVALNPTYLPRHQASVGLKEGTDLLLANVLSFDVKVWDPIASRFLDLGAADANPFLNPGVPNPNFGLFSGGNNGRLFETGTYRTAVSADGAVVFPPQVPSHGSPFSTIQIKIRVYEPKTKQTREATIQVDM